MANTISEINKSYASLFLSPLNYQVNPITNLIYNYNASKVYSNTVAKNLKSSVSTYLSSLYNNASELKNSSSELRSTDSTSVYNKNKVSTEDQNAITAAATSKANLSEHTINVSQIANSQANKGTSLNSSEKSFSIGTNTISIKYSNQDEKRISFFIDKNDTNKSSLEKMASSINKENIGIVANVVTDAKTSKSYISLASEKTGKTNSFSIKDIEGNAVSVSKADNITNEARDAEYSIDGEKYTSSQNEIYMDNNNISITLNKADNKDIKFEVKKDKSSIETEIKEFISSYNKTIEYINSQSDQYASAEKLKNSLNSIMRSNKSSLESFGIKLKSDGTLSVDSKKLNKAVDEDFYKIKNTFGGKSGIVEKVLNKTNNIITSPSSLIKKEEISKSLEALKGMIIDESI